MAIVVTGFLGAGKSALADRVRACLDEPVEEVDGRAVPPGGCPAVAVADAANLAACLDDTVIGPLVEAQIGAAGLVVLTRTDIVDAAPAMAALARITDAPVVEVPPGPLPEGLAARLGDLPPGPPARSAAPVAFAEWRYAGPAGLGEKALEALLAGRPGGLYRLSGRVRSGRAGIEVEVAGRLRQTRAVPAPAETALVAIGPKARFRPDEMALRFSEAVAAGGWLAGLFGHR